MTRAHGDAAPPEKSVPLDYFTGLYLAKDDPWDNATKWSDQRKYAVTMASLPRPRYRRGYEPGCAVGFLTRLLAARCDQLVAADCVPEAVRAAAANVRDFPHVRVEEALLPEGLPDGTFDLVVIGDLLYYLSEADMSALIEGLVARLEPGGDLVAVHFRDRNNPGSYDGFNVHASLVAWPGLDRVVRHEDDWFVLDVLRLGVTL